MKRQHQLVLLCAAVLLASGAAWYAWTQRAPQPPDVSSATPSSEFINVGASMSFYREALLRRPGVASNYVRLAQLHLQEARSTGREADHLPQARRLLDEALAIAPADFHALAFKGSLLNSLHRFEEARDIARRLIANNEHNPFAYGILVDALVELGRYDEAVEACDRMLELRPELASYARAAYIRELHGRRDGAIEAMRMAAESSAPGMEDRAWALYNLGELYLRAGHADTAAFIFAGILEELPGYAYAVGGLGRVDMARGDYSSAIRRFRSAYEQEPRADFLELLRDAYIELGEAERAAETLVRLRQHLDQARALGENVDMEYADFLAEHDIDAGEALELARRELKRRPKHLHVLETYAWALYKNGRAAEAVPYVKSALRLGTHDALLHLRAARIFEAAGDTTMAVVHLEQSLADHLEMESRSAARDARFDLDRLGSG